MVLTHCQGWVADIFLPVGLHPMRSDEFHQAEEMPKLLKEALDRRDVPKLREARFVCLARGKPDGKIHELGESL